MATVYCPHCDCLQPTPHECTAQRDCGWAPNVYLSPVECVELSFLVRAAIRTLKTKIENPDTYQHLIDAAFWREQDNLELGRLQAIRGKLR